MARRDSNPPSMTELCEYFEDRNGKIFKGEDGKKEERTSMKNSSIEKRIYQRNSRPSLRLTLPTGHQDNVFGKLIPTPPPFSPRSQPRRGRSLHSPLTPGSRTSSSSSGSSCCSSPYLSSPRSERLLRSPLTLSSNSISSGCSCCSSPCYDPSPRPYLPSFTDMQSQGTSYIGCHCCYEETPECCRGLPHGVPLSPYVPVEVPQTAFGHLTSLMCSCNMAPYVKTSTCTCGACYPQSPYEQQASKAKHCSLPSSPMTPRRDPRQGRLTRSMPCSPCTTSAINLSQGVFMPHQPLLRRRQQMKNENALRKSEEKLPAMEPEDGHDDKDGRKSRIEFFP